MEEEARGDKKSHGNTRTSKKKQQKARKARRVKERQGNARKGNKS